MSSALKAKTTIELVPLNSRVVVQPFATDEVSKGGIILVEHERPQRGLVLAVGPGELMDNGSFYTTTVKPGDKVLFGKFAGTEVELEHGEKVLVMRETDIIARIIKK